MASRGEAGTAGVAGVAIGCREGPKEPGKLLTGVTCNVTSNEVSKMQLDSGLGWDDNTES